MSAFIKEGTQFVDVDGTPILNGKLYIGAKGSDPVAAQISIFSDRALTIPLANPQTLNSFGESTNKIWIPGQYSMQVNNSNDVQKFQDLDAGEDPETGITSLLNIQGINTITADGTPTVPALINKQTFVFIAANAVTGAATLKIDATAAKSIKKLHDQELVAGDIEANQIVLVTYNSVDDVFELISNTAAATIYFKKGVDIASANDTVLLTDGNYNDITGTVQINGMTNGVVNEIRIFHFDGAVLLKHLTAPSAGFSQLFLFGIDLTTAANDEFTFIYDGVFWRLISYKRAAGWGNADIATGAAIATAKLASDSGIISAMLASDSVAQDELDTTFGEVSTSSSAAVLLTLPGGQHGFYPRTRETGNGMTATISSVNTQQGGTYGSFITVNRASTGTAFVEQRYVQASPPYDLGDGDIPLFIFVEVDTRGRIISTYVAPEAPWHYNGPTNIKSDLIIGGKPHKIIKDPVEIDAGMVSAGHPKGLTLAASKARSPQVFSDYLDSFVAAKSITIELTQAIKNADMSLIPRPMKARLADPPHVRLATSVVMLDPVSPLTLKLSELRVHDEFSISDLLHNGDLIIKNTALVRAGPPGVDIVDFKFR